MSQFSVELGQEFSFSFSISFEDMESFRRLSGDNHPIHTSTDFARSRGFPDRVVYGGLLLAQISRLVGDELKIESAVWNGIKLDFRKPLHPGQPAFVRGKIVAISEAVRNLELRVRIRRAEDLLATGIAHVSF